MFFVLIVVCGDIDVGIVPFQRNLMALGIDEEPSGSGHDVLGRNPGRRHGSEIL